MTSGQAAEIFLSFPVPKYKTERQIDRQMTRPRNKDRETEREGRGQQQH